MYPRENVGIRNGADKSALFPKLGQAVIDWWYVGGHALWIMGLAAVLATFSYSRYLRTYEAEATRSGSGGSGVRLAFSVGALLVGTGALLTSASVVERLGWSLFIGAILLQLVLLILRRWRVRGRESFALSGRNERDRGEFF